MSDTVLVPPLVYFFTCPCCEQPSSVRSVIVVEILCTTYLHLQYCRGIVTLQFISAWRKHALFGFSKRYSTGKTSPSMLQQKKATLFQGKRPRLLKNKISWSLAWRFPKRLFKSRTATKEGIQKQQAEFREKACDQAVLI